MTKIEKVANLRQKRFRDLFLMNAANRPATLSGNGTELAIGPVAWNCFGSRALPVKCV